jgi:L-rhamnose mutarotase
MSKKFNFLENIFELSETQNKEELPNEWEFIIRHQGVEKSKTCVCNCKIKNYSIFINRLNKHFIYCGDCCRKQLKFKCSKENVIFRLFNHGYPKQQYDIIKDIFKYSQNVIYKGIAIGSMRVGVSIHSPIALGLDCQAFGVTICVPRPNKYSP